MTNEVLTLLVSYLILQNKQKEKRIRLLCGEGSFRKT